MCVCSSVCLLGQVSVIFSPPKITNKPRRQPPRCGQGRKTYFLIIPTITNINTSLRSETWAPTPTCIPDIKTCRAVVFKGFHLEGEKNRAEQVSNHQLWTVCTWLCTLSEQHPTPTPEDIPRLSLCRHTHARTLFLSLSLSLSVPLHTTAPSANGAQQNNQTDQLQRHDYNNS